MTAIEINDLTKVYGSKTVVNKISLQVENGEIYGFLGRNGAGKSTFINMITGIVQPTSGSFKLLNEESLDKIKHRIGVLPDYSTLYDSMSAIDHLKYFSKVNGRKISTSQCEVILERVGLIKDANKKVGKYSFGMKKKLGIAQSIVHDPDLIFLDEPTSGVDAESALLLQNLIVSLQEEGKTIFMTSHNLNEIEKICSKIAIMKKGSIFNEGTLRELKKQYTSNIKVKVKYSVKEDNLDNIKCAVEKFGSDILIEKDEFSLSISSEDKIPAIIKVLTEGNIDIYRVTVKEPSLEEIFMGN
ncbi:ABC transporter ATP-binding protein [Bacillus subtilis]|uniref:ABC transporter ATP-binding protein n=1 Tax=Bacillus subtilis TaxID=1423 RepID=UPI00089DD7BD|nr:ABC transporter ATP-binding protein [Bacillus subtilis]AOY05440.1 ABC transporter ATP-binding protein [Bacillus subtilis]